MAIKKIAVLGGGMGSLTAVYQLTSEPDWKSKYEITVYQIGWRFGGKGASGRNGTIESNGLSSQRIEEHGLHLWFGFYDNAFNLIQKCYKDNNRPPGVPLATWEKAFTGYNTIVLEENINGQWLHWPFTVPENKLTPGYGDPHPTMEEYIYKIIEWVKDRHEEYQSKKSDAVKANIEDHKQSDHMGLIRTLLTDVVTEGEDLFADAGSFLLHGALLLAKTGEHLLLKGILEKLKEWFEIIAKDLLMSDTELRRIFIMADLGIVTIKGMIDDKVISEGFDIVNNYDYREWLGKHDAAEITINSAIVQGVYGLVFGGNKQYTFEAGTALRGLLRMGLTYKGSVYYRMLAGMGDAIFGPIYQVLQSRGVNFQFFYKATNIGLSADQSSIASISFDVQATLKSEYPVYDPLVTVQDLPCWPNQPKFEYLNEGNDLKNQNINLESYYSTWKPVNQITKYINTDFDEVLLGISIGALPTIAKELSNAKPQGVKWQSMIQNVIPISTIAYQIWLKSSIEQMKWPYISSGLGLLGSYQEPYDTWADMSDLIIRENWPQGYVPQNIAYFCGPTPQPYADEILKNAQTGNFGDSTFPAQQKQIAKNYAQDYLQHLSEHIWPGIWEGKTSFDYNQLIDLNNGTGPQRFDAQFFRSNIDPTELYVMSFTNSSIHRIKTDQTGYAALYITGDWIDNGFNAGCIEATVMSGLQAARAISGLPIVIPGEKDI
jgi:uncharacterized protein with NAD-binding domain and iron-sulfur cluster